MTLFQAQASETSLPDLWALKIGRQGPTAPLMHRKSYEREGANTAKLNETKKMDNIGDKIRTSSNDDNSGSRDVQNEIKATRLEL